MLEAALAAGIAAAGGHALLGGVLPTPGGALLVRRYGFDLAAVVSASHNPYQDNGIKFFGPEGTKLADDQEAEIERLARGARPRAPIGRVRELHGAAGDYLRELEPRFATSTSTGARILLDCANGATYRVAPEIFRRLGADVDAIAASPTAATSTTGAAPPTSRRSPSGWPAATTWALPSTATATACWPSTATARSWTATSSWRSPRCTCASSGQLPGDGVAVTVMTNYGFHRAMEDAGIEVATTAVGDRHVLEELLERGWALGGEQSGPHHRHRLRARPATASPRPAHARGAGRRATSPSATRWRSSAAARERARRDRDALERRGRASGRPSSASRPRSRAAGGCWYGHRAPSRWCA